MSASAHAKLLRALESGEVEPLGSKSVGRVNVRLIGVTNRNLAYEVATGRFREDLYYRLNVIIQLPPLRERREDILLLVNRFLKGACGEQHKPLPRFTPAAMQAIVSRCWSGNIRELRSFVERLVILAESELINIHQIRKAIGDWEEKPELAYIGLPLREARKV